MFLSILIKELDRKAEVLKSAFIDARTDLFSKSVRPTWQRSHKPVFTKEQATVDVIMQKTRKLGVNTERVST